MKIPEHRKAVLDLTEAGWTEERIASALNISPRTVRRHRSSLRRRGQELRSEAQAYRALAESDGD